MAEVEEGGAWTPLGLVLRARRRPLRLSQRALAERASVSPATVGRLETGRLDVSLALVLSVLDTVGLRGVLQDEAGRPFLLNSEQIDELSRTDTSDYNRLPAHLRHEPVGMLPSWTFSRRMHRSHFRILERRAHWLYRRTDPRPRPGLCHADPMEATTPAQHRFYSDLAPWWPLISPPEDYEAEAAFIATLLHSARIGVREVLELGSGGGHTAVHLGRHFAMTLVDLSPDMLAVSRDLNPRCRHVEGDMRTLRLGERFDAVLIHDAVDYMVTEDDLAAAIGTAFEHCRPGGMAVFLPDHVRETYRAASDCGGGDGADGRSARYHEWSWDPDPTDTWTLTTYAFVLRSPDGSVDLAHETHRTGLFARDLWLDLLGAAGFEASAIEEDTDEDREPRIVFVAHRPGPERADPNSA